MSNGHGSTRTPGIARDIVDLGGIQDAAIIAAEDVDLVCTRVVGDPRIGEGNWSVR